MILYVYTVSPSCCIILTAPLKLDSCCLTLSVPDVISGRGDVGLITLVDVYFAKITLRVWRNVTCVSAQILWADRKVEIKNNN